MKLISDQSPGSETEAGRRVAPSNFESPMTISSPNYEQAGADKDAQPESSSSLAPSILNTNQDMEVPAALANRAAYRPPMASPARANMLIAAIVLTQLVQIAPYGVGITAAATIARSIHASALSSAWIASSYPLTQGTVVLVAGRLGAVAGHRRTLALGGGVWVFFTLATAYGGDIVSVSVFRALAGVGGGLMVPNAVALLTTALAPGRRRNVGLALFGAMAPVGGAGGIVLGGVWVQGVEWRWLFFLLASMGVVVYGAAIWAIPEDDPQDPNGSIDWTGAYLGVAGLILFNFVWNQAPAARWSNPYEYTLLVVSLLHLAAFVVWEARFAADPILPSDIWKAPSFGVLMLVLFLTFMSFGIYIWYAAVFLQNIRAFSPALVGCSFIPIVVFGSVAAFVAAWMVSRVPAQLIAGLGCLATAGINVLLATAPRGQTYWAMLFPAMALAGFTADLVTAASQIITSSIVSKRHQGAAGSLIGTLLTYGLSTGLGFAGTLEEYLKRGGADTLAGYRGAAYLAVGFAGAALLLNVLFVRMKKNTVEGWHGEDAEMA